MHEQLNNNGRYLLVKHSEGWNVDRCTLWMQANNFKVDWCYPAAGQPFPDPANYHGVIVFGGAPSANDTKQYEWVSQELQFIERCLKLNTPLFGICLGAQMLARVLGAKVSMHPQQLKEIGFCDVVPAPTPSVFMPEPITVMQWHQEGFDLPEGSTLLASSELFANQAFSYGDRTYGVQFHPEVNSAALEIWHERNKAYDADRRLTEEQRVEQRRDVVQYDESITQWLSSFLNHWHTLSDFTIDSTASG